MRTERDVAPQHPLTEDEERQFTEAILADEEIVLEEADVEFQAWLSDEEDQAHEDDDGEDDEVGL